VTSTPRSRRGANKSQIRVYDLADPMPREPEVFLWTLGGTGGSPLPRELAICLSFYADRNLRRQRGRVYLGPINTSAIGNTGNDMTVEVAARNTIRDAAITLMNATPTWCVWSEARQAEVVPGGGNFGAQPVTAGWVDDAVDIQRRRGLKTSTRTIF
jgi:hypothetical protein